MKRAALEDMRATLKTRLLHRQQTGRETTADLGDLALLLDALLEESPRPVDYARDPQPAAATTCPHCGAPRVCCAKAIVATS